jgi:predicted lipid-binding transport protein (Tim44 family)
MRQDPVQGDASGSSLPRDYSPKNVGNDASARPWEQSVSTFGPDALATAPVSSVLGTPAPPDFDVESFLDASKDNFVKLQAAWDRGDVPALRAMMTDTMIEQIQAQLVEREKVTGSDVNKTDVVMLEAQLLGVETIADDYLASVEFSGLIREEPSAGPNPFREVWSITRPRTGTGGWLVAGVQALQ